MPSEESIRRLAEFYFRQPGNREELEGQTVIFPFTDGRRIYDRDTVVSTNEQMERSRQQMNEKYGPIGEDHPFRLFADRVYQDTKGFMAPAEFKFSDPRITWLVNEMFDEAAMRSFNAQSGAQADEELKNVPQYVESLLGFALYTTYEQQLQYYQMDIGITALGYDPNNITLHVRFRPDRKRTG